MFEDDVKQKSNISKNVKTVLPRIRPRAPPMSHSRDTKIRCHEFTDEELIIEWSDESKDQYPIVWLRDNCQCPSCFSPTARSRAMLLSELNVDISVAKQHVTDSSIVIEWNDGHKSSYNFIWLKKRCFRSSTRSERRLWFKLEVKLWDNASMQDKIPTCSFTELMEDDFILFKWLCTLESIGICLITGAPQEEKQLQRVASRVAYLRKTNYGETFVVKTRTDAQNAAYTGSALGLHIDLTYFCNIPGMQMLHCINQIPTEGGESQHCDGINAALQLKKSYPEYYEILSNTVVDYYDVGTDSYDFYQMNRMPVLKHDYDGNLDSICFSNHGRDSYLNIPPGEVKQFYKALTKYNEFLYAPENMIERKLQNGDIMCFHNYRVLHGRSGFTCTAGGRRHLEGGYIEWDEMRSCRRVLQQKFGKVEYLDSSKADEQPFVKNIR